MDPGRCFRCRELLHGTQHTVRFPKTYDRPPGRRERGRPERETEGQALLCAGCLTDFKAWLRGPPLGIFA